MPTSSPDVHVRPWSCRCWRAGAIAHATLIGELDLATLPRLDEAIDQRQAGATLLVLDLRALAFIDASGLRGLLALHQRLREQLCRVVIVGRPVSLIRLLDLVELDHRFEFADSPADLLELIATAERWPKRRTPPTPPFRSRARDATGHSRRRADQTAQPSAQPATTSTAHAS